MMREKETGGIKMHEEETPRVSIPELYAQNPWPRKLTQARKHHQCDICGWGIDAGSHYYAAVIYPGDGNDNDEIFTYRAHADCDVLWKRFGKAMDWEWPFRTDWEAWLEILDAAHVAYPADWRKRGEV